MTSPKDESPTSEARRRFLKAAVYVPPLIVSTLLVQRAEAQPMMGMMMSCMPATMGITASEGACIPDF